MQEQLKKMRAELIAGIEELAPGGQVYLGLWVRYCATIKYLDGRHLSYTGPAYTGVLQPNTIDDLPIEGLLDLYNALHDLREATDGQ